MSQQRSLGLRLAVDHEASVLISLWGSAAQSSPCKERKKQAARNRRAMALISEPCFTLSNAGGHCRGARRHDNGHHLRGQLRLLGDRLL